MCKKNNHGTGQWIASYLAMTGAQQGWRPSLDIDKKHFSIFARTAKKIDTAPKKERNIN